MMRKNRREETVRNFETKKRWWEKLRKRKRKDWGEELARRARKGNRCRIGEIFLEEN